MSAPIGNDDPGGAPRRGASRRPLAAWAGTWLVLALAILAGDVGAQQAAPAAGPVAPQLAEIEMLATSRRDVAAELESVARESAAATTAGDAEQVAHLARVTEGLQGVDRQLEAHELALARRAELAQRADALAASRELGSHLTGLTPDLDTYDGLLDERDGLEQQLESAALAEQVARDRLAQAEADTAGRTRAVEAAREAVASNDDPARTLALRRDQRLKELARRRAAAERARREVELDNAVSERAHVEAELALAREAIEVLRAGLVVDGDAFHRRITALEARRGDLGMQRSSARFDHGIAEAKVTNFSERAGQDPDDPVVAERLLGLKRDALRQQQRLAFLDAESERIEADIEAWEVRQVVLDGGLGDERLGELREGERRLVDSAHSDIALKRQQLTTLRTLLDDVRRALEAAGDPELLGALRQRQSALEAHAALIEQELARIETSLRLHLRLLEEIELQIETTPLAEAWSRLREAFGRVWSFSFYEVSSAAGGEPVQVTVGKLLNALLVFVVGLMLARWVARWLAVRVFPRLHLDAAASATYRTLVFYFLLLTVFLSVLRIMDIPLTAFTVLGGALAIGVGFGSQNLVNNFISGLIIMAERPIRIGDLIEVDATYGIVESIGARSTTVLTSDNVNIVIPNSAFLENNVVNWTLSNDVVRTKVRVGVAYGSSTRDVDRLLYRAVEEHGKILEMPAPQVIFDDFGDNALLFDVYFWLRARTVMERRRVQSDVRFRIDNLFREAGITIAFPQRDVHIDSLSPLEVRMVRGGGADAPPPARDRGAGPAE